MQITIRITRRRVIVGGILAALLAGVVLLRAAHPGRDAVFAGRNGIRARLAIPKDLQEFPVEQYAGRGDWYVYRQVVAPRGACNWHLKITCAYDNADKWTTAFRRYLQKRGRCIERGGDAMLVGQEQRLYMLQDSGGSATVRLKNLQGSLHITFEYYKPRKQSRIWQTRFGRYLATVLLRMGVPIDAMTRES